MRLLWQTPAWLLLASDWHARLAMQLKVLVWVLFQQVQLLPHLLSLGMSCVLLSRAGACNWSNRNTAAKVATPAWTLLYSGVITSRIKCHKRPRLTATAPPVAAGHLTASTALTP
jgi:hypothetical protein